MVTLAVVVVADGFGRNEDEDDRLTQLIWIGIFICCYVNIPIQKK